MLLVMHAVGVSNKNHLSTSAKDLWGAQSEEEARAHAGIGRVLINDHRLQHNGTTLNDDNNNLRYIHPTTINPGEECAMVPVWSLRLRFVSPWIDVNPSGALLLALICPLWPKGFKRPARSLHQLGSHCGRSGQSIKSQTVCVCVSSE